MKLKLYVKGISIVLVGSLCILSGCGKGPQGAQGPAGSVGAAGADSSGATVVKLCPGTTTYPNTFVEVAFCINDKLYGTYSANDGFSAELPPGQYESKAVNSSCDFTVGPNCTVSPN